MQIKLFWYILSIILCIGNKSITFAFLVKKKVMKVHDVSRLITRDGWYQLKSTGTSHRQYKHPTKKGRVTIPGKLSHELPPKTLNSILNQAGLK